MLSLVLSCVLFFFFKQKTAYEMRISDWSSDVCSSDLAEFFDHGGNQAVDLSRVGEVGGEAVAYRAGLRERIGKHPIGLARAALVDRQRIAFAREPRRNRGGDAVAAPR